MNDEKVKLVIGALLHDIGKVVYRAGADRRNHSVSGYEYLKNTVGIKDEKLTDCVRFHHAALLSGAAITENSFAYIVYMADNIAAATDRRKREDDESGFDLQTPLQPIFNILNGNNSGMYYRPGDLKNDGKINYPVKERTDFSESRYNQILANISDNLKGIEWDKAYINSLLEVMEANLSFVPSSTSKSEVSDISLYDHLKLTAAAASCIYEYLQERQQEDYKKLLFSDGSKFFEEDVFILYSMDVSGIQNFIYTITTKNALRTLRARSFYLEIMMEHMIDELLDELELSRANLIYSGGGHCYLLMPNTKRAKEVTDNFQSKVNQWFIKKFDNSLYVAGAYAECSGNSLQNLPEKSYSKIFETISKKMSEKKSRRYSADDIIRLNSQKIEDYSRECKVCKRIGSVDSEGVCSLCRSMEKLSQKVLYEDFFSVVSGEKPNELPLPGGYSLLTDTKDSLVDRMNDDTGFVRAYGKNVMHTGKKLSTKLWVGNYTTGSTFEEFANQASGIKRIGVLRADVDNLGHAFVAGFRNEENHDRYVTISRTATLSRQLSLYFKLFINRILSEPEYTLNGQPKEKRNAAIVYSGGDDLFIVGAWDDVIELAVDIRKNFTNYSEGTLSISAGIGIYADSYPISAIAEEVAEMEDKSKGLPGKNALTLLEDGMRHDVRLENGKVKKVSDGTYAWDEFTREVLDEKFTVIYDFFGSYEDRGKAFLYNLLELIRNQKDKINFARFVYLISRLEPGEKEEKAKKEQYQKFSRQMCEWIKSEKDCRQLKTAITLYSYYTRETEG